MPTEEQVVEALKEIVDPHTNMSVYDMGLISGINVTEDEVSLIFRPTSPFCPLGVHLALNIKRRLIGIDGTQKVDVKIVGHNQEEMINRELETL